MIFNKVFIPCKRIKNNRPISPEAEEKDSESDTEQPPNKVKKTDEQGTVSYFLEWCKIPPSRVLFFIISMLVLMFLKREKSSEHVIIPQFFNP